MVMYFAIVIHTRFYLLKWNIVVIIKLSKMGKYYLHACIDVYGYNVTLNMSIVN